MMVVTLSCMPCRSSWQPRPGISRFTARQAAAAPDPHRQSRPECQCIPMSSSGCHSGGKRIEEEVERRDVAIAGDDEVGTGIGRGLAWPTRHPLDASGRPTEVLGFTDRRVAEIGVGRFDSAGYPVDLIPTAVDASGLVE